MYSASGRATPGLLSQLARTRREILPSSMHTPWAGSNRYKISELMSFTAERPLPVDSPSLPFWVRFNEPLQMRRQHYGFTTSYRFAATLDTGPLAKSYPRGSHTRLSSNHFQSARASLCYTALYEPASTAPRRTRCDWENGRPQCLSYRAGAILSAISVRD
jgi:hypothetical protein